MKRTILVFALVLLLGAKVAIGQATTPVSIELYRTIPAGSPVIQTAVEYLTARNTVMAGGVAQYKAGRAITLQPGFTAQAGTVFEATIEAVMTHPEATDNLTLTASPNPFSDKTLVRYRLSVPTRVQHLLTDAAGNIVRQHDKPEILSEGEHVVEVPADKLPAGIYFFRLKTEQGSQTIRLLKQ